MIERTQLAQLLNSPEFLAELQEGLFVADRDGNVVFVNRALTAMLGFPGELSLAGREWTSLFPASEVARLTNVGGVGQTLTVIDSGILDAEGHSVPVSVTINRKAMRNVGWLCGTVLPTANLHQPAGLGESTSRRIVENSIDGICIIEEGRIVYVNRRLEVLTGYTSNQLLRLSLDRLVAARDRETVARVNSDPGKILTPVHHEVRIYTRSGREVACELRIVPTDVDSRPVLLCFLRDISDLRRAETARTDFMAMVSHELRTPLASIKEAMSLLSETAGERLEPRELRYMAIAREEMDRLNRMISNLIEVSRMESGKKQVRLEPTRIEEVIARSIESLSLMVTKKHLKVNTRVPDNLRPVIGDQDSLLQVFNNLLDNAIKYSPDGGTIVIDVRQLDPEAPVLSENGILSDTRYVEVKISDSGPGIPAEFLDRIFGKYERVDPHGPGTGLGLAIVQSIIEMHHGRVWAKSEFGEGTSFSFILPTKDD